MAKIGVIYWSGTGNTEAMANLVAEGAGANGDAVEILTVDAIDAATAATYDKLALGCPAMGDETLEEGEFEPFYEELKGQFAGKPVALFGSYSWAEGAWMQTWQDDARSAGLSLISDGLIVFEAPEGDTEEACKALGVALANA